jgi:hypothetical protein
MEATTVLRINLVLPLACILLLRENLCTSCLPDGEPCEYEVVSLAPDAGTPWGTTPAEDIAALEIPQHGMWRWGESGNSIEIEDSGVELQAWATFVHDPGSIYYSDHVDGGRGWVCDGPTVMVDGTLTFTDEQGGAIVSVPLTVERQHMAGGYYSSSPMYWPISLFSELVHETAEWDTEGVYGNIIWLDKGLLAGFDYLGQSKLTETTGHGVSHLVGGFVADGVPPELLGAADP